MRTTSLIRPLALLALGAIGACLHVSDASAQDAQRNAPQEPSWASDVSPTQEMWFYDQERRRYEDPSAAIRRNAESRAAARRARIESRNWFGYSASRPRTSAVPSMSDYGVMWTSGTWNFPNRWTPGTTIVVPQIAPSHVATLPRSAR